MRIKDIIYFSPSLKLEDLDTENQELVLKYFQERITAYYFDSIEILIGHKQAFSAGALECLLIDAFARYSSPENGVEIRIVNWCMVNLGVDEQTATDFYKFFRCGLLHESHIKSYGQFCFDEHPANRPLQKISDFIIVNPTHLLTALKSFFDNFIATLRIDDVLYNIFITRIIADFSNEVERAERESIS
jgi:hypothetical protein